jgi:hypothetical protein
MFGAKPKTTRIVEFLIEQHLSNPDFEAIGLEIAQAVGLSPATTYPILRRLERGKIVLTRDVAPSEDEINTAKAANKRLPPPKTYFRINPDQLGSIRQQLAEQREQTSRQARQLPGQTAPGIA